jgi:large subunit ribosomal protein L25
MNKKIIKLDERSGSAMELRSNHKIPVVLYGFNVSKSISLCVDNDIKNTLNKLGKFAYSTLFEVHTNGKVYTCIIKCIEKNPLSEEIMHMDFQSVDNDHEFMMYCPVNIINKEKCEALKSKAAMFIPKSLIEVRCSLKNFVSSIDIDVSNLNKGQKVHTKDISGIKFVSKSMLCSIR